MDRRSRWMAGFGVLLGLGAAGFAGPAASPAGSGTKPKMPLPGGDGTSGITGLALVGPVTPNQRPGDPPGVPLPDALITVKADSGGPTLASARADVQGKFRISLPAGRYLVVPLPPKPGPYPRARPQTVGVRAGKYSVMLIMYDSGLR